MKKKDKVTGNTYRINDHKLLAIRFVERADGSIQYEIEQMITEEPVQLGGKDKTPVAVKVKSSMRLGLTKIETNTVINDLMKLYIDNYKSKNEN